MDAIEECLRSNLPYGALARVTTDGKRLGITATPAFLTNGPRLVDAPPLEMLRAHVEQARSP